MTARQGLAWSKLSVERKSLLLAEAAVAGLCVYRAYDYIVTGFFVSDEFGYFYNAVHGLVYGGRWFFGGFNILLFKSLGISTPNGFALLLPFYLLFWSGLTIYIFYLITKLLGLKGTAVAASLLSSFGLVSFVLLSVGFLTEPVGLALAMAGIYFLLRYVRSTTDIGRLILPGVAAGFLGAAGGTREPYNALLVAGGVLIAIAAISKRKRKYSTRYGKTALALLSIVLFLIPAGYLYYANSYATSQASSLGQQIGQAIVSNPSTNTKVTVTQTSTFNVTSTITSTLTQTRTSTLVTSSVTTVQTVIGTVTTNKTETIPVTTVITNTTVATTTLTTTYPTQTTTIVTTEPPYPFYASSLLLNTVAIFVGGIALGWGPLAALVGLAGFVVLVKSVFRSRDLTGSLVLLIVLASLGSYFVVSYIFAPDPSYLSFQNYSTIIRFSDTALPAFFLLAPFALAHLSTRRRAVLFGAAVIVFLVAAVPAYQVYASSNLNYTAGNPFSLSYRSPAIQVRDYVTAHPEEVFDIVGVPYGWYFTPGVENLKNVTVVPFSTSSIVPPINYSQFVAYRWSSFYVYSSPNFQDLHSYAPYVYALIYPESSTAPTSLPYHLVKSQTIISNEGFVLVRITLSWNA